MLVWRAERVTLKCPFCDFEARHFISLKVHVRKVHRLIKCCPVCGYNGKNILRHLAERSKRDVKHKIAYSLLSKTSTSKFARKVFNEVMDVFE